MDLHARLVLQTPTGITSTETPGSYKVVLPDAAITPTRPHNMQRIHQCSRLWHLLLLHERQPAQSNKAVSSTLAMHFATTRKPTHMTTPTIHAGCRTHTHAQSYTDIACQRLCIYAHACKPRPKPFVHVQLCSHVAYTHVCC